MLRKLTYDAKRFIKYNYQFLDKNMRKKFMNNKVKTPSKGEQIRLNSNLKLEVPDHPIIPFI